VLARYVEAIQSGLAVLDTHFERVDAGIVIEPLLEPKDPYILRPLPYLIGTSEFMQDNYVGLGDLLTIHDEDVYNVEKIEKIESSDVSQSSMRFQPQLETSPVFRYRLIPKTMTTTS
jgi:hypothetical protein